jgi:exopolyphosphatase/guanosine-5'-triphosphate,3'-diphosphate pyrophosphatase
MQAERVCLTANEFFLQVREDWELSARDGQLLMWAAQLHEIGLMIAHSQHHKHGAYILENMDLAGFSRQEQQTLSILVRLHRRKFRTEVLEGFDEERVEAVSRLAVILRLAVLFNRGRHPEELPRILASVHDSEVTLTLAADWLHEHALTQADIEDEQSSLSKSMFSLIIKEI